MIENFNLIHFILLKKIQIIMLNMKVDEKHQAKKGDINIWDIL
nr:MAG TPA: hypothetical protein [Bacteriophage sp.]